MALKITRTRDDVTSTSDLRITKDPFGPVFVSTENEKMFILIAHLKGRSLSFFYNTSTQIFFIRLIHGFETGAGFRKENIHIEINNEGNKIEISGMKPVQEMVLRGWIMHKKDVEFRAFRRVFRIPDMVDLDRIKAKYNEEESTFRITMPKRIRGIFGIEIEELKEEDELLPQEKAVEEELPKEEEIAKKDEEEPPKEEEITKNHEEEPPKEEEITKKEEQELMKEEEVVKKDEEVQERRESGEIGPEEPEKEKVEKEESRMPQAAIEERPVEEQVSEKSEEKIEEKAQLPVIPMVEPEVETVEPKVVQPDRDTDQPQMAELPSVEEERCVEPPAPNETEKLPKVEEELEESGMTEAEDQETQQQESPSPPSTPPGEEMAGTDSEEPLMPEPYQFDRDKGPSEEANQSKKKASKRHKLCPPFMMAGSALLVSLIVMVIHCNICMIPFSS